MQNHDMSAHTGHRNTCNQVTNHQTHIAARKTAQARGTLWHTIQHNNTTLTYFPCFEK
jgi:hypothetical protein